MTAQKNSRPEISLIVPTYNERENILPLVERVHRSLDTVDYELIVVDDNSPDGTAEAVRSLVSRYPLRLIVRSNERGLSSAVLTGFREAMGEVIGVIDADLQHPPEMVPGLLQKIRNGADLVIGSRYVPGGAAEGWSMRRKIMSRGARALAAMMLPAVKRIKDPMSGFFVFKKKVIDGIELKPIGYKILLEVLVRGHAGKIAEVPYTFKERARGKSNLGAGEQINYLRHLYRLAGVGGGISRFVKFCVVGGSGVLVNLGIYWVLTRVLGMSRYGALAISIESSIISNFILNEVWTFRDRRALGAASSLARLGKFNLIASGGAVINYSLFWILTHPVGWYDHDIVSEAIAIVAATLWNFSLSTWWAWAGKTIKRF